MLRKTEKLLKHLKVYCSRLNMTCVAINLPPRLLLKAACVASVNEVDLKLEQQ